MLTSSSPTAGSLALAHTQSVLDYTAFNFTIYAGCSMVLGFTCMYPMVTLSERLKWSPPLMIALGSIFVVLKLTMCALTEFYHPLFYIRESITGG